MSDDIARLAASTALANMFAQGHFNICTIDQIAATLHVTVERESHNTLRLLHCINWNAMPPEIRAAVPGLIATCLQGLDVDQVAIERLLPRARTIEPAPRDVTPEKPRRLGFFSRNRE